MKGTSNQVTKCGDLSAEDSNNYFITAVDTSDTISTHYLKSQQAEQPQSKFFLPVTDDEDMKHISTLKNIKLSGWIALMLQFWF